MGLDYFFNSNSSNISSDDDTILNTSMYFGDVYPHKKKKCFSKDKCNTDRNQKSIDFYFSNKINNNQNNISTIIYNTNSKKDNDFINNSNKYSVESTSSSEDNKKKDILSQRKPSEVLLNDKSRNLRKSYYNKLLNQNVVNINKETIKNNTIFIFDWDDTLFFTTHLNPSKNNIFFYESKTEKRFMNTIEYYVVEILKKALSKGKVLIITNSGDGWVHACAKFYYPNLLPILDQINIISARELYQDKFPNEPITWKVKTFNDLKQKFHFEKCIVSNIICIGDDNSEIIAAKKLGENFENCLVKTIKFRDKPNLTDLIKQIILINEQILRVYNYPKSLTIQVNKKKNQNK